MVVTVKDNESIDHAIKRLRKKVQKSGVLSEYKRKRFFESNGEKRRRKEASAERRRQKQQRRHKKHY